jgi:flagellar hook-associated protein 3 FlgL
MRQFLAALDQQNSSLGRTLEQLSDGKRVRVASDDPSGARRALSLRGRLVRTEGYNRSSNSAASDLQTIDSRLGEIYNRLVEARSSSLRAASGSFEGANGALADGIESIREEIISLANTVQNGRYLFGGTQNQSPPFDAAGVYSGNSDETQAPLDTNLQVGVTVDGSQVLQGAVDVLATLDSIAVAIRNNDQTTVGNLIADLTTALKNVNLSRGDIGTRLKRVEDNLIRLDDERLQLQTRIADIEDVDIAEVAVDFSAVTTAQNALSQAATSLLGRSLFDYLG